MGARVEQSLYPACEQLTDREPDLCLEMIVLVCFPLEEAKHTSVFSEVKKIKMYAEGKKLPCVHKRSKRSAEFF